MGHLFQILLSPFFFLSFYKSCNTDIKAYLIFYFPLIILNNFYWSIFPWYICKSFSILWYSNFLFFNFYYLFSSLFSMHGQIFFTCPIYCAVYFSSFLPMYFGLISIIFLLFIDDGINSCIFLTVFSIWSFIIICSSK